jgi:hypothetical protein
LESTIDYLNDLIAENEKSRHRVEEEKNKLLAEVQVN